MQIKPVFEGKNVLPIVFAFNDEYSKYFSIALQSLIENSNETSFYDIIIFSSDISKRNKKLLEDMLPQNFSLRFFDITEYISDIFADIELTTKKYWSVEMYYRIVIPLIMQNYERVLYLDSDIVINGNINELFDISFEDKMLLAVIDSFNIVSNLENSKERMRYIIKTLEFNLNNTYFNSGVLVFNIRAFEPLIYLENIKKAFKKIKLTYCPDQDILNFLFKNKVKLIEQKWNLQYHVPIFHKKDLLYLDKAKIKEYNIAFSSPTIIHYTSPIKPWSKPAGELAEVFWKYARGTVFYEEILSSMYKAEILESRYATNLYTMLQTNKRIILWGASIFLEDFLKKYDIESKYYPNIIGIIDKDAKKEGKFLGGYRISTPQILKQYEPEEIILTIIHNLNECYEEVKCYLKEHNINTQLTRL